MTTTYVPFTATAFIDTSATKGLNKKGCNFVGSTASENHDARVDFAFTDPAFHTVSWSARVSYPDGHSEFTKHYPTEGGAIREGKRLIRDRQARHRKFLKEHQS